MSYISLEDHMAFLGDAYIYDLKASSELMIFCIIATAANYTKEVGKYEKGECVLSYLMCCFSGIPVALLDMNARALCAQWQRKYHNHIKEIFGSTAHINLGFRLKLSNLRYFTLDPLLPELT